MRLTRFARPSVACVIAALIALLVMPGSALAQEAEESEAQAGTEATEDPGTAKLRFMLGGNSCAISYFVDGEAATEALHEGMLTEFSEVPAGKSLAQVYCAGSDPSAGEEGLVLETSLKLKPGSEATLSTVNGGKGPFGVSLKAIPNKPKPKVGQAQLRIVNLCQECGPVEVASKGKPLERKLGFGKSGKYKSVKPGEVKLVVKPKGAALKKLAIDPFELTPGTANTLFLTMSVSDGTFTPVVAFDGEATSARFMNASREPIVVDVYVDGKLHTKRLYPGQAALKASDMLVGEHLVQIVEAGSMPVDGTLHEATVDFPAGATAVEAVAGESLEAVSAPTSRAPKPETAQIRFAHIDPEIPAVDIEMRDADPVLGLAPGEWTDYMTVPGESPYIWIRPSGDPMTTYHELPLAVGPGENVTAYLGGSPDIPSVEFVFVSDPFAKDK